MVDSGQVFECVRISHGGTLIHHIQMIGEMKVMAVVSLCMTPLCVSRDTDMCEQST
jgi:hypothetical protein